MFISIHLEAWHLAGTDNAHLLLASDKCRVDYAFTPVYLQPGDVIIPSPFFMCLSGRRG